MNTWLHHLLHPLIWVAGIWTLIRLPPGDVAPVRDGTPYGVLISSKMYLPDDPFHITDERYNLKTNFETRTVEICQPTENGRPLTARPVIFFVHGGAWVDGYANWYTDILTPVLTAEEGWIIVNVDYRLTSDQVFLAETYPTTKTKAAWYDDNLQDVAAAFTWTVQNIADYGGDQINIFLFGHSAGGHLVSLLTTHPNYRHLRSHMRGVISMSGAYDLNELSVPIFKEPLNQTFRGGYTDTVALAEASPITYVVAGDTFPPFYILHCEFDIPSLPEQAVEFHNRLRLLGYEVEKDYLSGYTHSGEIEAIADDQETVTQNIVEYIATHTIRTIHLPLIGRQFN